MDLKATPDARAEALVRAMTLDEKLAVVRGDFGLPHAKGRDKGAIGSAGYVPGVPRLGFPDLQESDASLGVANPFNIRKGDGATPLPSGLATASTWDPELAFAGGAMIGHEARAKGFNVLLAGGVNLARDPRNGRNFEYLGEDPLLAGQLAGQAIRGVQSNGVVSTIKHFVLNDQETGRMVLDARMDPAALRETDLLAFEIAIETGRPGAVMCAYNRVNGAYACDNAALLDGVLKGDWGYSGWVMSDWGAVHSVQAAVHGLDQESGSQLDGAPWFGAPLKTAIEQGQIPASRLDDMVRRIARSMIAAGAFDAPIRPGGPIDYAADAIVAERVEDEGLVLLKNDGVLPLPNRLGKILVVGGHADVGVLSGAGSSQVIPPGGGALTIKMSGVEGDPMAAFRKAVFDPSSPLAAIRSKAPQASVDYDDGADPLKASAKARGADVVLVFATQWMIEGSDAPNLSLPDHQDALISALATANPRTVVVLETGDPVLMPWLSLTPAVIEAWYPGARGGQAIADVLFGDVNPSGRLPITFPAREADAPRPTTPGAGLPAKTPFAVSYGEGADLGYRWVQKAGLKPLFPFGFGLSYTRFSYSNLRVSGGAALKVSFTVTNTGSKPGLETPQVYAAPPGGVRRLVAWRKLALQPGERQDVVLTAAPRSLARFETDAHGWRLLDGAYVVSVGASSQDLAMTATAVLAGDRIKP
jgi:beta-glucosidase